MGEWMVKILKFKPKPSPIALKLIKASMEIDNVLLAYLKSNEIEPKELAGLLAHRLGTLLSHFDDKQALWEVCERILLKQASLD